MAGCLVSSVAGRAPWVPSKVRRVAIYHGSDSFAPSRGVGALRLKWPAKHPLESDSWWVDATAFCDDIDDVIGQVGYSIVSGDDALTIPTWGLSSDGLQAGLRLRGGTPGVPYVVRVHLTFLTTGEQWGGDIAIQVAALGGAPTKNPSLITNNGDVVLLAGIPFPTGA